MSTHKDLERGSKADSASILSSTSSRSGISPEAQIALQKQLSLEASHQIKYRSCSWQKTAALLFSEYICLAMVSFPWSFSVLGMVPGVIVTIAVAATCLYTSLILGRFCLAHPDMRDICDIGGFLFGDLIDDVLERCGLEREQINTSGKIAEVGGDESSWGRGRRWAYAATSVFFVLNNVFIQALHVLVGAKLLNTLSNSSQCTIVFGVISAVICFLISLPRTLAQMSHLGTFSAVTMGIAVLLCMIFAGIQDKPFGWTEKLGDPIVTAIPVAGTTYVAGMSAFLNITYTLVGQAMIPSFIAEMKNPKDFPKALWAVTISQIVTYTICGAVVYHYVGNQYVTAPAFGSLTDTYKKVAFSFAIPTIIFLGALYSSVVARFLFFRLFSPTSPHRHSNTVRGWVTWVGIVGATWIAAFILAEVIPFFSDLLSLMSSLFDGWFGFIFWAMAYLTLYPGAKKWDGPLRSAETLMNYFFILLGLYILIAGTYVSVESIILSYQAQAVGGVFTCASNAI